MNFLKSINTALNEFVGTPPVDLKSSDGSDAGKHDVANKTTGNDVRFSLMRNTINSGDGDVTGSDVANYIERAEELNDEVDTVPFGLETDDGQIVKVYVNAAQADQFEEKMSAMLGMEDDIEEAINRLTTEFDIVDVVWPTPPSDGEASAEADDNLEIDDSSGLDIDDDFADGNYDEIAASKEATPAPADADEEDEISKAAAQDEAGTDEKKSPDEEEDTEGGGGSAEDEDEDTDEDEEGGDESKPKKKKKKAQPAEPAEDESTDTGEKPKQESKEHSMTIGSTFLQRVLAEDKKLAEASPPEDRDGIKDGFNIDLGSQGRALVAKLKLPFAKRLVAFHVMAGVPARYLNTSDIEATITEAADMLRKKVAVRRAFLDLYDGLANAKGYAIPKEATNEAKKSDAKRLADQGVEAILKAKEAVKVARKSGDAKALERAQAKLKKLTEGTVMEVNKRGSYIQKLFETVLVKLGLPEELIVTTGPSAVGTGIFRTAEMIEQDADLERALRQLATRLGIRSSDMASDITEEKKPKLPKDADKPITVQGVKGMKSKPFEKTFKNQAAMEKWMDKYGEDVDIHRYSVSEATDFDDEGVLIEAIAGATDESPVEHEGKTIGRVWKKDGKWGYEHKRTGNIGDEPSKAAAEAKVKQHHKRSIAEAVDVGNDDFAEAVMSLVAALGIPDDVLARRRTQLIQALRQKKQTLTNRPQLVTMMKRVEDLVAKGTRKSTQPADQDDQQQQNESSGYRWNLSALQEKK